MKNVVDSNQQCTCTSGRQGQKHIRGSSGAAAHTGSLAIIQSSSCWLEAKPGHRPAAHGVVQRIWQYVQLLKRPDPGILVGEAVHDHFVSAHPFLKVCQTRCFQGLTKARPGVESPAMPSQAPRAATTTTAAAATTTTTTNHYYYCYSYLLLLLLPLLLPLLRLYKKQTTTERERVSTKEPERGGVGTTRVGGGGVVVQGITRRTTGQGGLLFEELRRE